MARFPSLHRFGASCLTLVVGFVAFAFAQSPPAPPAQEAAPATATGAPKGPRRERPKKTGVTTPGVQIPIERLKPEAEFLVGGAPDWIAVDETVYVSNKPKNVINRLNLKTNKPEEPLSGFNKPCSGLTLGFGSLWVPNCGDQTLVRVDVKSGKTVATLPTGVANSEGGLAASPDSIWMLTNPNSTLARIDPLSNKVVAEIPLPTGCVTAAFGNDAVWVTCTESDQLLRVDPATNLIAAHIKVGPKPRFLTVGEGAVWTLNQGDGKVSRVDPQTNKVVGTIDVGVPGGGGDISAGEGSVWVTSFGFPLSRIDPETNKVVQQFVGPGGDAVRAGRGSVWLCDLRGGKIWRLDPKLIAATQSDN